MFLKTNCLVRLLQQSYFDGLREMDRIKLI
jgi:hypothetical protein